MSEKSGSDKLDNDQSRAPTENEENNNDAQKSNIEEPLETSQTVLDKKKEASDSNANTSENIKPDLASPNGEGEQPKPKTETDSSNSVSLRPVTVMSSSSASSEAAPKVIAGPAQIRSTTPLVVGARVVTSSVQGPGATSLALAPRPQPGRVSVSSVAISQPRVTTLTTAKGAVVTLPRISTPSQSVPMTRTPQTVPLQLPANFQVPQGEFTCGFRIHCFISWSVSVL